MIEKLKEANRGLARKFPDGLEPFQIMTRLFEEGGELARQVNLFEDKGIKRAKYGAPDPRHLALEVRGVLLAVFQLVEYYELEREVEESLDVAIRNLRRDGYLPG
jgi:NTP pyrophosphatase (non-canonical NTP hydrolase)